MSDWLMRIVRGQPGARTTPVSLRRDLDVFLRTYLPVRAGRDLPLEDTFDCPLVELGLLVEPERGTYQLVRGPKPALPEIIFLFALYDYWDAAVGAQRTVSFEQLLHGPGSPGAAFKLSENALALRLERLPAWSGLSFDDTAGVRVILRSDAPEPFDPIALLRRHYAAPEGLVGSGATP